MENAVKIPEATHARHNQCQLTAISWLECFYTHTVQFSSF